MVDQADSVFDHTLNISISFRHIIQFTINSRNSTTHYYHESISRYVFPLHNAQTCIHVTVMYVKGAISNTKHVSGILYNLTLFIQLL